MNQTTEGDNVNTSVGSRKEERMHTAQVDKNVCHNKEWSYSLEEPGPGYLFSVCMCMAVANGAYMATSEG